MPGIEFDRNDDEIKKLEIIRQVRLTENPEQYCLENSIDLLWFQQEVFSYRFKDRPNYDLLKAILEDLRD